MADTPVQSVPLGYGFVLECSFPPQTLDTVQVALCFRNRRLWTTRSHANDRGSLHRLGIGLARIELGMRMDMFEGELACTFVIEVRGFRSRTWRRVVDVDGRVMSRFDPSLGVVANSAAVHAPQVNDPRFGRSQPCTPTILRFHVDDVHRDLCDVGSVVKKQMFPHYPPFVFNTVACVGAFAAGGPGLYADPRSDWFNTFLGYYQLDCARPAWDRPFGYKSADGADSVPEPEDLVRLGKSDWNWFSNWNYGVPTEVLVHYDAVPANIVYTSNLVTVGASRWHEVTLKGTEAASCYVSDIPGAAQLTRNTVIHDVWHRSFGEPSPQPNFPLSFIPTVVDALVDMAYWEDDAGYHTVLFGGTAIAGSPPGFLAAQVAATKAVIAAEYPDRGFAP